MLRDQKIHRKLTIQAILIVLLFVGSLILIGNIDAQAQDDPGSISGRVTAEETGEPLSDIQVCAADYDYHDNLRCAFTSTDGSYLITGIPSGEYRVNVGEPGWAQENYNNVISYDAAFRVSVYPGQTTEYVDFSLAPGGFVDGYVFGPDGEPLEGVAVGMAPGDYSFGMGNCTDENGYFVYTSVPMGFDYRIYAHPVFGQGTCGNTGYFAQQYWDHTPDKFEVTWLSIDANQPSVTGIIFDLEPGGRISGIVTEELTGNPISNIHICFEEMEQYYLECVQTRDDGTYTIWGLTPGFYQADIFHPNWGFEYYQDKLRYGQGDLIEVIAGETTAGIDFALVPGATVQGYVFDTDGNPLEEIAVNVIGENYEWSLESCTDQNGFFSIESVPYFQEITVRASSYWGSHCDGPDDYAAQWWEYTYFWSEAETITFDVENPTYQEITFVLEKSTINGLRELLESLPAEILAPNRIVPLSIHLRNADRFYQLGNLDAAHHQINLFIDGIDRLETHHLIVFDYGETLREYALYLLQNIE